MRSFKTFLAEQRRYTDRPQAQLQAPGSGQMPKELGAGGTGGGSPAPRAVRRPFETIRKSVDLLTRQPYRAVGEYVKRKTGLNVPVRSAAAGTVASAGVDKSLNVFKREVNKYLRSQGLEAGRYTPEFDMPQPDFDPERKVPVPDYKEPRKAFGRTVPGINKAKEGPDTLGKLELLNISRKALGSTPGEQAKNLGRVMTTQQGLEYLVPALEDTVLMGINPGIPAITGTFAPDTSLELRRRGARAATKAFTALTGKKPAEIYSPDPTEADIQATRDFDKLRRAWLSSGQKKAAEREDKSTPSGTQAPSTGIDYSQLL